MDIPATPSLNCTAWLELPDIDVCEPGFVVQLEPGGPDLSVPEDLCPRSCGTCWWVVESARLGSWHGGSGLLPSKWLWLSMQGECAGWQYKWFAFDVCTLICALQART